MIIQGHKDEIEGIHVPESHALNTVKKVIFNPDNGWSSHVMRVFTMHENGGTHKHQHDWPHYVYVLNGSGKIEIDQDEYFVEEGNYMLIPSDVPHSIQNQGKKPFEFMCIVPPEGEK